MSKFSAFVRSVGTWFMLVENHSCRRNPKGQNRIPNSVVRKETNKFLTFSWHSHTNHNAQWRVLFYVHCSNNSKVLGSRELLKDLAIYVVKYGVMLPWVGHGEDVALSCVKVRTPLLTPHCQVGQVFLEFMLILNRLNDSVDKTVICKQSDLRIWIYDRW